MLSEETILFIIQCQSYQKYIKKNICVNVSVAIRKNYSVYCLSSQFYTLREIFINHECKIT